MADKNLDKLNKKYRELKAEKTKLLAKPKVANDGKWPDAVLSACRKEGLPPTDYVAQNLEGGDAKKLKELDAQLIEVRDARRLIRKESRQVADKERKQNVAATVKTMSAEERAAFRDALAE